MGMEFLQEMQGNQDIQMRWNPFILISRKLCFCLVARV